MTLSFRYLYLKQPDQGVYAASRRIEPRVGGLERDTDDLCHLYHRDLLELKEDEDLPLVVVQPIEDVLEDGLRLAFLESFGLDGLCETDGPFAASFVS